MSDRRADSVRAQIALLAADVGRLRAALPEPLDSYAGFLTERVALRVEALDCLVWPTAADAFRRLTADGADEDSAVTAALDLVDGRSRELRSTLRLRP
jgi:hypothetical protein